MVMPQALARMWTVYGNAMSPYMLGQKMMREKQYWSSMLWKNEQKRTNKTGRRMGERQME